MSARVCLVVHYARSVLCACLDLGQLLAYRFDERALDVLDTRLEAFPPCSVTDDIPLAQPAGITVPCTFLQAFASPERLVEMVQKVQTAMQTILPKAISKMKVYLNNPSTHSVLFKPIKSNIAEAHAQIAALLDAEYTQQEVESIQLTTPAALEKLLAL